MAEALKLIIEPKRLPNGNVAIIPSPKAWAARYALREGLTTLTAGKLLKELRGLPDRDIFGRKRTSLEARGGEICIVPPTGKTLGETASAEYSRADNERWENQYESFLFGRHKFEYFFEIPAALRKETGMLFIPPVGNEGKPAYKFEYLGDNDCHGRWVLLVSDEAALEVVQLPPLKNDYVPGPYRALHKKTGLPLGEETYWGDEKGAIPVFFNRGQTTIVSPVVEFRDSREERRRAKKPIAAVIDFNTPLWMQYPEIGKPIEAKLPENSLGEKHA